MQQTKTRTTMHLRLPDPRRLVIPAPASMAICVVALAGIIAAIGRIQAQPPAVAVQPTPPLPIIVIQREIAPAAPVQQVAVQAPAVRYVVGFDSPNGRALGAIPAPDVSAIIARWGDEWLQTTHDGAPIWIRASELGLNIPNLMPELQPVVVYVSAPQPEYAAPTPATYVAPVDAHSLNIQQFAANDHIQRETGGEIPIGGALPPAQAPYTVDNAPQPEQQQAQPAPTPAPQPTPDPAQAAQPLDHDSEIEAEWAREQLRLEHPEWQPRPSQ
jgi:hypothetical protein